MGMFIDCSLPGVYFACAPNLRWVFSYCLVRRLLMNTIKTIRCLTVGLLAAASFTAQAATYTNGYTACSTGPQGEVSGSIVVVNGLQYLASVGTSGNDVIQGVDATSYYQRDIIWGTDGDDQISGGEGDDIICGGSGDDTLNGGNGNDTIVGGLDNDLINGGFGSDALSGEGGSDVINGEGDDDFSTTVISSGVNAGLYGGDGDDIVNGGPGKDWLAGQNGNDQLYGDSGNDEIGGGPGVDFTDGGTGTDKCEAEKTRKCELPLF